MFLPEKWQKANATRDVTIIEDDNLQFHPSMLREMEKSAMYSNFFVNS